MSDTSHTNQRQAGLPYPSVNTRIVVPFLLAIIVIAGLGIFIVTRLVTGSIQERFNNQLVSSANSATNAIVDVESKYLGTLRLMAFTDGVADAISDKRSADLDTWLRPIAATNIIDELLVLNAAGDPLLYLNRQDTLRVVEYETPDPPTIQNWQNVQRTLQGQLDSMGDKFVDVVRVSDADVVIYFNAPVTVLVGGDRQVVGVIVAGLRIESLVRQISQQALSDVTLLDLSGAVLTTTLVRSERDQLNKTPEEAEALLQAVMESSPIETIEVDGIPHQLLYSPFMIRGQPTGLMAVGLSSNYIVEQSSTSRNLFGLLFAGFFVTVGVIGLLVARTITNPIQRLVNTTRAIRDGDFSRRVQLVPRDELGELGTSFDMMTDQLVSRNEEVVNLLHQQVAETAQREAVLTSISDAVIVQDTGGRIILQNQTAQHLMDSIATNRQQRERFMSFMNKPQELRRPQIVTLADHHFSVLSTPVMLEQDRLLGHVIVFRDITAIIETEHLKDELVLQMSHELRTPLGVVRGYVDLVKLMGANNMSADEVKYVEGAREGLSTLERLVNQVVDVSAILSSRFTIELETFNLAYLIGDVFTNWQPAMKQRNLQFSLMLATNDLFIEADPARIEQLMDHVLRNAHSYTLPGGLVEICAELNGPNAFISVTDSGKGIAPDEINRVFERLYRGRAAMAGDTDARGMGLGLYISQQIVEAHHGTIKIESAIDLGTIVTIELPTRQR